MPTYEYLCTSCQNEWEEEQSIKEDPQKFCPKCKQETARRQISRGGGFILKGGGWYSDLYSSSSNKAPAKSESSESKGSSGSSSSEGSSSKGDSGGSASKTESKASESSGSTPSKPTNTSAAA